MGVSIHMMYVTITLALHIHFLVIQRFLRGELRDASPEVYDQDPSLTVLTNNFDYYLVA